MKLLASFQVFWILSLSTFHIANSQMLPYNPTTILVPQNLSISGGVAYVFLGSTESETNSQFLSLNISSTISASNISLQDITPDLSFFTNDSIASVPTISSAGEISVYAGSCDSSAGSQLWRFTPLNTSADGDGTWISETTVLAGGVKPSSITGPQFLSGGLSFSTLVNGNASESNIYTFGGMCPNSSEDGDSNWQSSATYTNLVTRLVPPSSSTSLTYTLDIPTVKGPPIAEAGFTITGLSPIYSNISGIQTQQQNFVLLGGHTQTAFINMSQIAVWSLPEESWSFVGVDSPQIPNTELAAKSAVERSSTFIDSRSGHSAVLTEDGSSLIVLGGWVGDITQAADPQLIVLHLGTGFGGNGDWTWSIPTAQPSGSGIYGHGAAMLPGNVMMVLGGYNISSSGNTKRAAAINANPMFLNVTSMTWSSSYTNPSYVAAAASHGSSPGSSKKGSDSKKIGLGVGLGVGIAVVIAVIVALICYRRRNHRQKESRERDIRALSEGAMTQRGGLFPWAHSRWNGSGGDTQSPVYESGTMAEYDNPHSDTYNFGATGEYPAPPPDRMIPRKPVQPRNTRGLYQPAPGFDFGTMGGLGRANSLGTAGPIHPIYEDDEDADHVGQGVGVALGDPPRAPNSSDSNRYSDPFKDTHAAGPSGLTEAQISAQEREREISSWVSDWAAADALMQAQARSHSNAGRLSPSKRAQLIAGTSSSGSEDDSGRTASNLSERSAVSTASIARSVTASQGESRSNSLRGFIGNVVRPFSSGSSTTPTPPAEPGVAPMQLGQSARSSVSFATARTSFAALQAEGESLLGRRPDDRDNGSPPHSPLREEPFDTTPGSPSKSKPKPRGQSWLGPLRSVFGSISSGHISPGEASFSSHDGSPSPTHTAAGGSQGEPRRTLSAGATLWRRKQGKGDWDDSADDATVTGRSVTGEIDRDLQSDDEWDIERAVERRVVQVMFTVPKEKLRVVNHDVAEESDGASLVNVARQSSMKGEIGMVTPAEEKPSPLSQENLDSVVADAINSDIGPSSIAREAGASTVSSFRDSAIGSSEGGRDTPDDRKGKGKEKGRSRVLDMVEEMERRSERSASPASVRSQTK
ncbi:hypothetical protein F5884DRAFT_683394 [Xylogone sp. PMI_703]|nr:hypothetical protein F5884DRAFT_683394 [Xylogone sp. PMI_703]